MDNTENKEVCMACSCPCEMHKEHNHPMGNEMAEHTHGAGETCAACEAGK
jgi:hypothetical protein